MVRVIWRPFVQRLAVQRFASSSSSRATGSGSYGTRALSLFANDSDNNKPSRRAPLSARWTSTKGGKKGGRRRNHKDDDDDLYDLDPEVMELDEQAAARKSHDDVVDSFIKNEKKRLERLRRAAELAKSQRAEARNGSVLSPEQVEKMKASMTDEEKEEQDLLELFLDALQMKMNKYDTEKDDELLTARELKQFLDDEGDYLEASYKGLIPEEQEEDGLKDGDRYPNGELYMSPRTRYLESEKEKNKEWRKRIDHEEPAAWGETGNDDWQPQDGQLSDEAQREMDEAEFRALFDSLARYHDIRHSEVSMEQEVVDDDNADNSRNNSSNDDDFDGPDMELRDEDLDELMDEIESDLFVDGNDDDDDDTELDDDMLDDALDDAFDDAFDDDDDDDTDNQEEDDLIDEEHEANPFERLYEEAGAILPQHIDLVNHKKIMQKLEEQNERADKPIKPVTYFRKANHPDNVELALDVELLRLFLSPTGQILPRRFTGLTAKEQRKMKRAIKVSRQLALLPYLTRYPLPSPAQWQEIYARQQAQLDAEARAMEASGEYDEE